MRRSESFSALIDTLKLSVSTLRHEQIPFMLGGSLAAWARGGPEPQNDLDVMVTPEDADAALEALARAGMRPERPPEEWLYKAWNGGVMVDLIFRPSGLEITREVLARAELMPVMAVGTPVMALDDMLVTMLCALDEHSLDLAPLLAIARSLREQIEWASLRARVAASPYAMAFLTLVEELGVTPGRGAGRGAPTTRVRVISSG